MRVKFFYRKNCPKCPAAKQVVELFEEKVDYNDLDDVDGLTEGAYYQVSSTPTTIVVDEQGREIKAWRGSVPRTRELKEILFQ